MRRRCSRRSCNGRHIKHSSCSSGHSCASSSKVGSVYALLTDVVRTTNQHPSFRSLPLTPLSSPMLSQPQQLAPVMSFEQFTEYMNTHNCEFPALVQPGPSSQRQEEQEQAQAHVQPYPQQPREEQHQHEGRWEQQRRQGREWEERRFEPRNGEEQGQRRQQGDWVCEQYYPLSNPRAHVTSPSALACCPLWCDYSLAYTRPVRGGVSRFHSQLQER